VANVNAEAGREPELGAGNFYGAVQRKWEQCGAIFTDLRHTLPRKLPSHAHELSFFALLLEGEYGERYERRETQFRPFTVQAFRIRMRLGREASGFLRLKFVPAGGSVWRSVRRRSIWRRTIAREGRCFG
jgi:hypothetical protein